MKRFSVIVLTIGALASGISAFAYGTGNGNIPSLSPRPYNPMSAATPNQVQIGAQPITSSSLQSWLGKPVDQLTAQLGAPDYTFVTDNNDKRPVTTENVLVRGRSGFETVTQMEYSGDTTYVYNQRPMPTTKNNFGEIVKLEFGIVNGVVATAKSSVIY